MVDQTNNNNQKSPCPKQETEILPKATIKGKENMFNVPPNRTRGYILKQAASKVVMEHQ